MEPLFTPDDTEAPMLASLQRWLRETLPFDRRKAFTATPASGLVLWQGLTELGLTGLAVPEAQGGLAAPLRSQLLALQALGHALVAEPYAAAAVLGAHALALVQPAEAVAALQAGIADGSARPVLALLEPAARHDVLQVACTLDAEGRVSGRKTVVRAAPQATHWLVSARAAGGALRLALVPADAPGVTRRDTRLADGSWAAELAFDRTPALALLQAPGDDGAALLAQLADLQLVAAGAESIGVAQRLLHDTIDYIRQRKQFGVALASFQALQHRLADMHIALAQARALLAATLPAVDAPALHTPAQAHARVRAVAACQVAVARAARAVGEGAVQLHGGMGMTDELSVGHGFQRLVLVAAGGGGEAVQIARLARWQQAEAPAGLPSEAAAN